MPEITYNQLLNWENRSFQPIERKAKAKLANAFLEKNNYIIEQTLIHDLLHYYGNVDKLRLFTFDAFTENFLSAISNTHRKPIYFKFLDVDDTEKEKFVKVMNDVRLHPKLAELDLRVKLHNTVLVKVSYYKQGNMEKFYLDSSYDPSTCEVIPFEGLSTEPKIIIRPHSKGDEKMWYVWNREEMVEYQLAKEPKIEAGMITNDERMNSKKIKYWPFVVYQLRPSNNGDFWGNGYYSIITAARFFNFTLTYSNDDDVKNSMRMLLLNFRPSGTPRNPYALRSTSDLLESGNGGIKMGFDSPVYGEVDTDREPKAELVYGDLHTEKILAKIEKVAEYLSTQHGVSSIFVNESLEEVSSLSMKLRNETQLSNWANEIQVYRTFDYELVKKIIEIYNFEFPEKIDAEILDKMSIEYSQPVLISDTEAEYRLAKEMWGDNISTPKDWLIQHNPELNEQSADEILRNNKVFNEEFYSVQSPASPFDEFIETETTGSIT